MFLVFPLWCHASYIFLFCCDSFNKRSLVKDVIYMWVFLFFLEIGTFHQILSNWSWCKPASACSTNYCDMSHTKIQKKIKYLLTFTSMHAHYPTKVSSFNPVTTHLTNILFIDGIDNDGFPRFQVSPVIFCQQLFCRWHLAVTRSLELRDHHLDIPYSPVPFLLFTYS